MKLEIEFRPHCDDSCTMGVALFTCPVCTEVSIDYTKVYYAFTGDGRLQNDFVDTLCQCCKHPLHIRKTGYDNYEVDVKEN